jgi:hypothetical protein
MRKMDEPPDEHDARAQMLTPGHDPEQYRLSDERLCVVDDAQQDRFETLKWFGFQRAKEPAKSSRS